MRVGWGFLLLVSATLISFSAVASDDRDSHDCALWMEYFALQERVFSLAQRNLPVPASLRKEMKRVSEVLNSETSNGATVATEFDVEDGGFEPYVAWSPDGEAESNDEERAERDAEEKNREVESEYYSFNQKLARLQELLEQQGARVNHSAIQAIFPRMLATRAYGNYHYRFLMKEAGVEDGSLQVFTLALWAHNTDLAHPHLPEETELKEVAQVMAAPVEMTKQWLNMHPARRPAKVQEVLEAAAEELDTSVGAMAIRLFTFMEDKSQYPARNFGRLIYNFLGANDDLFPIHDTESLDRFLARR